MDIKELQKRIDEIIKKHGEYWEPLSMLARLTEEVGELSRAMNIKYGGKKKKHKRDGKEIEKELADTLIALTALSNGLGIDLEKEINDKIKSDVERNKGVYY